MSDENTQQDLLEMGLQPESKKALILLPLVAVAWADGSIQEGERTHILQFIDEIGGLDVDGAILVEDWLRHPPTSGYIERGIDLLCRYFRRGDAHIDPKVLDRVLDEAQAVAASSGSGLLGMIQKVSRSEVDALAWLRGVFGEQLGIEGFEPERPKARRGLRTAITDLADPVRPDDMAAVLVQENFRRPKFLVNRHGMTVGADIGCDVPIEGLAPRHFRINVDGRKFYVEALDDKAAMSVNGERVGMRRVFGGERIVAGSTIFSFKLVARDLD